MAQMNMLLALSIHSHSRTDLGERWFYHEADRVVWRVKGDGSTTRLKIVDVKTRIPRVERRRAK